MHAFTDAQLLVIWESGLVQHPIDRALTLLLGSDAQQTRAALAEWPVGRRDGQLLEAYRMNFGPCLEGLAACPGCGRRLEFALETASLAGELPALPSGNEFDFNLGDLSMRCRLPNSRDLAAAAMADDETGASLALLHSCVLALSRAGQPDTVEHLTDTEIAALEEQLAQRDPQADLTLALTCAECGQTWQESLDVVEFLWTQVAARARRLLLEVHSLASAYGWSESDILAMSPVRRQAYLEMLA